MEAIKKNEEIIEKLKKDIETVMCWRKFGKALNREQQAFADRVAQEMINLKNMNKVGVQLVSREHITFIRKGIVEKGMQPIQGSDAVAGIVQDVVATGPAQKDKPKMCFHTGECNCNKVTKASVPASDEIKATLPTSAEDSGKLPRKTSDIKSISKEPIEGQNEGQVNAVADSKTDPKQLSPDDEGEVAIEEIGHQPNLPMPRKMAEELVANAKWGVELGVYKNISEAIERILSNKEYNEFTDTKEKKDAVKACLNSLQAEKMLKGGPGSSGTVGPGTRGGKGGGEAAEGDEDDKVSPASEKSYSTLTSKYGAMYTAYGIDEDDEDYNYIVHGKTKLEAIKNANRNGDGLEIKVRDIEPMTLKEFHYFELANSHKEIESAAKKREPYLYDQGT